MGIQRDGRETNPAYWFVWGSGVTWYERNRYYGAWYQMTPGDTIQLEVGVLQGGYPYLGSSGPSGVVGSTIGDNGTFYCDIDLPADQGFSWRVNCRVNGHVQNSSQQWFTTLPAPIAFQNLAVGGVTLTSSAIDFTGQWSVNTTTATGYAQLFYKKVTDVGWTLHSTSGTVSGFAWNTFATTVTGLTSGTAYQFKLTVTRTTVANTTADSTIMSANTLASTPTLTSEAATSVSNNAGQMNGTIDANLLSTDCSFVWNKSALRTITYNNAVNVTNTKTVTIGSITYTFKTNTAATGNFAYAGQPSPADTVVVGTATYEFVADQAATGGKIAYVNATIPTATKTITIPTGTGNAVYTFVAAVAVAGDVKVGVDADSTMTNLQNAINNSGGTPGVGNDYIAYDFGAGPAAHPLVVATVDTVNDWITLAIATHGTIGNITMTTTETSFTLTQPTGGDKVETSGEIKIGVNADATFLNLTRAINKSGGTEGVGQDYLSFGGLANTLASAAQATPNVNITALTAGSAGNSIALSDTSANITTTAMSGGLDITGPYGVLIGANSDATMLNLTNAVNNSGGTAGIDYVVAAANPDVVATIHATDDIVECVVPTNSNPALSFSTTEVTFTLTTDAENPFAQSTANQNFSNDGTTPFGQLLTGLSARRKYYYKARAIYYANGGGTLYGTELSFTTSAVPLAAAVEEEHMQIIQFDGKYATATKFNFTLRQPSSASSDLFYTGGVPNNATEAVILHTDSTGAVTAYASALTNAFTKTGSYLYTMSLTAAEMTAEVIDVIIHSAGAAFRDQHIQIRTAQRISEVDIDATNGPTNATALRCVGNGTGDGILASTTGSGQDINAVLSSMWLRVAYAQTQGAPSGTKIKLDANASTTDNYYTGCVVVTLGGFGAGQSRVITAYNGGQREATVDTAWSSIPDNTTTYAIGAGARPWNLSPAAELASVPGPTAGYGAMLQLLFQRFAFKIDQTASAQTWFNSSGVAIFDRAVSDDGVTQTVEALANV